MTTKIFTGRTSDRGRWRGLGLTGSLAAFALVAAACGSSTGGNVPGNAPGAGGTEGGGGGQTSAANGGAGGAGRGAGGTDIFPVTAQTERCPSGQPGQGKPAVTLGTKDFTEQFLLGRMYKQALESRGYTVNYRSNIGGSETIDQAFQSGAIDMYPEYLGEIETSVAGFDKPAKKVVTTYQRAKNFEQTKRNATILKQTPYQNTDVIIVKSDFAQQNNLQSVPDLKNVGPNGQGVKLAAQPPFKTRFNGLQGMKQVYGLTGVKFVGIPQGQQYDVLKQNANGVNAIDAFSTDAQLTTFDSVALEDPENIFGYQYVAPVIKQPVLQQEGPKFSQTLNCVSSLLTTPVMQKLNAQIQLNGRDEADVARKFLTANDVLQ